MKFKVKIILTALMMTAVLFAVQAQRGQRQNLTPEQRADKQTSVMTDQLSLTPEQAAKVKDINLKYAGKQKAQKDELKGEREQNRSAMQELQNERKKEISAVLTKDQQVKFEEIQAERGKNRQDKMKSGKGARGEKAGRNADPEKRAERMTQQMTEKLALNQDQAAKVKAINLDFAKQQQTLRAESPEDQRPEKKAVENLRKQHQEQLKNVLTKEQYSQWEQMAKERQENRKGKGEGKDKVRPGTKGM